LEYGKTRALTRDGGRARAAACRLPPRGTEQGEGRRRRLFFAERSNRIVFSLEVGDSVRALQGSGSGLPRRFASALSIGALARWWIDLDRPAVALHDGFEALAAWDVTLQYKHGLA